jgi:hypothetical protein
MIDERYDTYEERLKNKISIFAKSSLVSLYHYDPTVEEFLYLPSNLTINRREEMQRKFGGEVCKVDKDVRPKL